MRKETKQILDSIQPNSFEDFAYGSMIGAFIADSMGSLEEFIKVPVPEERLPYSLAMPGGGPHRVGPGQITDDSEMAMSLAYGITKSEKQPGVG